MKSVKFDFDFGTVYNDLKNEQQKRRNNFIRDSSYHYLSWDDFYHDALTKTVNYINDNLKEDSIDEDRFKGIYWTTSKFLRMKSVNKKLLKTNERINFSYLSEIIPTSGQEDDRTSIYATMVNNNNVEQTSLDHVLLIRMIDKSYPTVQKVLSGYSFTEGAKEAKISIAGFCKRYKIEVKKLIDNYHA